MADIIILGNFYADSATQNTPSPTQAAEVKQKKTTIISIGFFVGLFAAYLSWTCNTAMGMSDVEKVIYAIFAYMFGGLYLLYYFFVRYPCPAPKPAYYYF